jgi:hypothetical protein
MRKKLIFAVAFMAMAACALAAHTTSSPQVTLSNDGFHASADRNLVLLIETTDTFLDRALTDLGVAYDLFSGEDFSGVDLSGYTQVFLGMDGGGVEAPSVANLADFVNGGGCLHIYGGTCWQSYAMALNDYLLNNDVNNYCWSISNTPHVTIVDSGNYLATGLPASYNFVDSSAAYYATRSTDGAAMVAAMNGDQVPMLLWKVVGNGILDICINSAYDFYYSDPSDYGWAMQVVANMLTCDGSVAVQNSTWGNVKSLFR